jgi:glycine dehydrogenase subunit 1
MITIHLLLEALISRQEFLTSYTPYQPEVAQGTLQYIFEYQSMICELTGMEVSNASMYDGATATAEAMFMAYACSNNQKSVVSSTVNPRLIEVMKTAGKYRDIDVIIVPSKRRCHRFNFIKANGADTMGLIVQNPNYYGIVENYNGFADVVHEHEGLLIMVGEGQHWPF